jgi:hypothetical protein
MSHLQTRRQDTVLNLLVVCTVLVVFWGLHSFMSEFARATDSI